MFSMQNSGYKYIILIVTIVVMTFGGVLYWLVFEKQAANNQIEWAVYSVNVPAFSDDSKNDYFSFKYPKSEYIQLEPSMPGRLLRLQNYDPNIFSRGLDGKYYLEFFIDTEGYISCEQNVANGNMITNSQGTDLLKGQARQSEKSGAGAVGIAACMERPSYVLYMQGSDNTGKGILDKMIDSIHF